MVGIERSRFHRIVSTDVMRNVESDNDLESSQHDFSHEIDPGVLTINCDFSCMSRDM